jgi:Na+-transporting methylmalonyl-CoA/oxaloacetate decarboxylase gamma subunit
VRLGKLVGYLLVLAGVSFVAAFLAAFVCVLRGSKPFVVTRGVVRAADRVHLWLP